LNPIKQLAGQTAVYGLSSIVARVLSYLLVPFYTRVFLPQEYGIVNEMYAYVSLLIVVLTYGFETGFFRFSQSEANKDKVYSTALISLLTSSSMFILFAVLFAGPVANMLRYPDNKEYVVWFSMIIAMDALSAIPFALLRFKNKAKRFALVKIAAIIVNVSLNLFFLLLCPYMKKHGIMTGFVDLVYKGKVGVGYVFISNLISSAFTLALLLPEFIKMKYQFDSALWKKMMRYSLPLLVVGLAGIVNETMDRIFLKYMLPKEISLFQVGIYGACYKISIIMTLFIQAFRFAAEPFFFSQSKNENAKKIYADVMKYFVIVCTFIFLAVMLYIDVVKYFVGEKYYEGLPVVPILLIANLCLGIYYNLSIWYKLTGQTRFGAFISILGALITIVLNIWLIPIIGYMGSAWTTLICYATMMVLSYIFGQKYYHVSYNLKKILGYIGLSFGLYVLSIYCRLESMVFTYIFNTLLLFVFVFVVFLSERKPAKIKA
jgi:O-antigen/teichoic acid export membrane protein